MAAKNKKIGDTADSMESLDGCNLRSSSSFNNNKCWAAANAFDREAKLILAYWDAKVFSTGGVESTKNR